MGPLTPRRLNDILLSPGAAWAGDLRARIERARYWAGPVLLLGGRRELRESVARLLHELGPTRGGEFRRTDCREPGQAWLVPPTPRGGAQSCAGTLYLERLECLPLVCQRQLLMVLEDSGGPGSPARPGAPRIMAGLGVPRQLEQALAALEPELVDALDKWRIHMGAPWHSGGAQGKADGTGATQPRAPGGRDQ